MSRVAISTDLRASAPPAGTNHAADGASGRTSGIGLAGALATDTAVGDRPSSAEDEDQPADAWEASARTSARPISKLVRVLHAGVLALVLGALALPGCASTPEDDGTEPAADAVRPDLAVAEFARNLGLRMNRAADGRVTLDAPDGGRILLFPGTSVATAAGRRVDLSREVSEAGSELWLAAADADLLDATWRTQVAMGATRPVGPTSGYRVPIPSTTKPSAGPGTVSAKKPATSFDDNRPSSAETAAWGVTLRRKWSYLVVHHSASAAGSAAQIDRWHRDRGYDGLGYDFVIGNGTGSPDGAVEVGFRWKEQREGAHAKTAGNFMNEHGIGICLVGDFTRTRPTAAQMRSLDRLCTFLAQHCSIPAANLRLHGEVKATDCPGKYFPRDFAVRLPPSAARVAASDPR